MPTNSNRNMIKMAVRLTLPLALQLLLITLGLSDQIAHAQNVAPPQPSTGAISDELDASDLVEKITGLSIFVSAMVGIKIAFGQPMTYGKGGQPIDGGCAMDVIKGLVVAFGVPTMVHLIGTLIVNSLH